MHENRKLRENLAAHTELELGVLGDDAYYSTAKP